MKGNSGAFSGLTRRGEMRRAKRVCQQDIDANPKYESSDQF